VYLDAVVSQARKRLEQSIRGIDKKHELELRLEGYENFLFIIPGIFFLQLEMNTQRSFFFKLENLLATTHFTSPTLMRNYQFG